MVTTHCSRRLSTPSKKSVLICQVNPIPCDLPPGTYGFSHPNPNPELPGYQLQYEWTGHSWVRLTHDNNNENVEDFLHSWLNEEIVTSKKGRRFSLFSRKQAPISELVVSKRGFVPLENLSFDLTLRNFGSSIGKVCVQLVQKITTFSFGEGWQSEVTILVEKRFSECNKMAVNGEVYLAGEFLIPRCIVPSLTRGRGDAKACVDVSYTLEYTVETAHGRRWSSGEATVVIGRAESGNFGLSSRNRQRTSTASVGILSLDYFKQNSSSRKLSIESGSSQYKETRRRFSSAAIMVNQTRV